MSKFKIGDKVIPVKIDDRFHLGLYEGETYLVDNIKAPCLIDIVGNFRGFSPSQAWGCNWSEEWFELADEQLIEKGNKEMTAEQIRNEILRIDVRIVEAKKDIENAETERSVLVEKLREKGLQLFNAATAEIGVTPVPCTVDNVKEGDILVLVNESWNSEILVGSEVVVRINDKSDIPLKVETLDGKYDDWTKIDTVKFK